MSNDSTTIGTLSVSAVNGVAGNVGAVINGTNKGKFLINTDGSAYFNPNNEYYLSSTTPKETTSIEYTVSNGTDVDTALVTSTVNLRSVYPISFSSDDSIVIYHSDGYGTQLEQVCNGGGFAYTSNRSVRAYNRNGYAYFIVEVTNTTGVHGLRLFNTNTLLDFEYLSCISGPALSGFGRQHANWIAEPNWTYVPSDSGTFKWHVRVPVSIPYTVVGGQKYKCFITDLYSPSSWLPVTKANSTSTFFSYLQDPQTNFNWTNPIVLDGTPLQSMVAPITLDAYTTWNGRDGDKQCTGAVSVQALNSGMWNTVIDKHSSTPDDDLQILKSSVVLGYIPEDIKMFYYMKTEAGGKHMTLSVSYHSSMPMLKCTDANGKVHIYL